MKLKSFALILVMVGSILFIPVTSADDNTISLHVSQFDKTYIVDVTGKDVASISVVGSFNLYTPTEQPKMQLFTTNENQTGASTTPFSYSQYTAEVLKKGLNKYLYIYVPSSYYRNGYDTETLSLDFEITVADESFFMPMLSPETTYEYVVITTSLLWNTFNQDFKQWKIDTDSKITNILITNVSDIVNMSQCWVNGTYGDATNTAGGNHWVENGKEITTQFTMFNDTQAKIRNYIRYCYDTYGTRYVLLAGNKNLVPPRIMFNAAQDGAPPGTPGKHWWNWTSAVDMYYSCLDGNWNNNTNSLWGEAKIDFEWAKTPVWDAIDWGYDITLGRILVDSTSETSAWITRLKEYVDGNAYSKGNYLQNIMIAGKNTTNVIVPYVYDTLSDEFPSNVTFVNNNTITQLQWNVLDDICNGVVSPYDGVQIFYHSGHTGTETPYISGNLNNSIKPQSIFYTEGCQHADFGASSPCRMENLFAGTGGFVCCIANSAYGWFIGSTWYSETMFSLMFNTSNETCFAKAHDEARELFGINAHSVCSQLVKGTIFFGDPALEYNWYNPESIMNPVNGTTHESIYNCYLNYTTPEDGNVSFYWGNDTIIHTVLNVEKDDTASIYLPDYTGPWLPHDTLYYWYVIYNETATPEFNFKTSKAWDLNEDGQITYLDISILISHYMQSVTPEGSLPWDIDDNGKGNYVDISFIVHHYGETY